MRFKPLIPVIFFLTMCISLHCQPKCFITHYGAEDGLPQHTIMSIVQDQKGFMWFSTWDGLCKFDGYNFYTYKIQQGDIYQMRSNRIDFICEDKYGNIWTLPYDREPHRFDPRTERFMGIRSLPQYKDYAFSSTKIVPTKSGKVWLLSDKQGTICVKDSVFDVEFFNTENRKIYSDKVFNVYEDKAGSSWILTDNGLYQILANNGKLNSFFFEKEYSESKPMQSFYSVLEHDNEIWFGSNNGRLWIYKKQNGQFNLLETNSKSTIQHIKKINGDQILITTADDGFFVYTSPTNKFEKYDKTNCSELPDNSIISCFIDKSNNAWFETKGIGVSKFNTKNKNLKHFTVKIESLRTNVFPPNFFIFEDKENRLWIHPRGGGFSMYNAYTDKLEPFFNEPGSSSWQFSNMLHTAFPDKQGNLWLSTRSHGLEKVIFNDDVFKSTVLDPNIHSTINNDVRSVFEDSAQNRWIATKGGKIYIYDTNNVQLGYLCKDGRIGNGEPIEGVSYCIMEDHQKNIWLGTRGVGVYKLTPDKNPKSYQVKHFKNSPADLYSLSNNNVYSIHEDKYHRIWIGSYGGGLDYMDNSHDGRFYNVKNNLKNYPIQFGSQVRVVSSDKYGNICVGTTLGLIMFSPEFNTPNTIDFKSFIRVPGNNESLSGNDIYDICTTSKGDTYFATFGGGINKIRTVDKNGFPLCFESFTTSDGFPSDVVLTIAEDHNGELWVATEGNLSKFNPDKKTFETFSEISRLMTAQNFSEGSRCTSKSGHVLFGFSKGLISIDPNRIKSKSFKPYVALTKFQIANKNVSIGDNSPLSENIDYIKHLKLNHKQNFINIEFAALDYEESKRILYAYKLEGFDKDWVVPSKQRIANYTNLAPGEYTFRVKSTNSDGIWMDNEHILTIELTPSFWQTHWAYLLYLALFVAVLYTAMRTLLIFYRLKDKVKLEYEQSEMKARFFTDISHEIRTPLTMIVSPVENIIEKETTPVDIKSQLQLVLKNTNRMLRMVNQILDFRKIQKQKLNIQEMPLGEYVSDVCDNFSKTAEFKNINLHVINNIGNEKIWVDRDSIEKLVYNLLINAFKYTPTGKSIEVVIDNTKKGDAVTLHVKDEGQGMTKEILNKLFTRFASFNKDKNNPSTGIGLSIVKEVVDKHHAKIQVESEVNKGSCFTVTFPKGIEHMKDDENIIFSYSEPVIEPEEEVATVSLDNNEPVETNIELKSSVLIVEDDADLRSFLKTILSPDYEVYETDNGKAGYEKANETIPDFIISDIMMPVMDGIELLQKIKTNPNTSHIPFILLSAKTNIESKLEGLQYGADDYLEKPFSVKYLHARINNIISQRKQLYEIYSRSNKPEQTHEEPGQLQIITLEDEKFIRKIKEEIEKNIDNSDFMIDDLATAVAMSRTVFFKKLKSLTGLAPIEFVRDIKIKHAAILIEKYNYSIKEISFMIGISDTKYFTQCFKKIVGMTPSEYRTLKKGTDKNMG